MPMLNSDYQFHHPLDAQVSRSVRIEAASQRKAAIRTAAAVVAANVIGFALLIWLTV